ncbi:thioredoxin family protein [Rhodococcus aetherivorans]|uniref:thioredoxin family protein n=2 Tax=Rhodococcus TaxID=1827 RepID=UPI001E37887F|nr:thioredoxin family protein [Rhodococcus aetherivorans]UGQ40374.1 thioredoxin family protein [Rhodococcus aetherivorans]
MTAVVVLLVVVTAALITGTVLRARAGKVRAVAAAPAPGPGPLLAAVGVGTGSAPVVLHFSADWCGPCAAVRRVVAQVVADLAATGDGLPAPRDLELDIDENPQLARELGVLSLPTTFLFDAAGTERYRVSGVPAAADLRAALVPLRTPWAPIRRDVG